MLEEECRKDKGALLTLEKEWLDTRDHIKENAVLVKNVYKSEMNQYMIYTLFSLAGAIHKMWYGYKSPTAYKRGEESKCELSSSDEMAIMDDRPNRQTYNQALYH